MANGGSLALKSCVVQGNVQLMGYDMYDICDLTIRFKKWCDSNCSLYALMLHDNCLKEDGTFKTPHVHYVFHLNKDFGSPRLLTTLNRLAKALDVDTLAVSIFKPKTIEGALQYFTHQKYPEKMQYPKENFITNLEPSILDAMLAADVKEMNEEYLIEVVARARYKSDILREIGLYYYRCYRGLINDLWAEFHEVREVRERKYRKEINA